MTATAQPDTSHHASPIPPAVARAAAQAEALLSGGVNPETGEPQQPLEDPQQPGPEQPEEPQPQQPQQQRIYSENDFRAMQARFERAEAEKRAMLERANGLEALLAQVTTKPVEGPNPAELEPQRFLTEKDLEDYGTDFVDVQKRAALEAVSPEIQALRKEISYLKRGVGAVGENIAKQATERVYTTLDQEIGTQWEQMNNYGPFKQWLTYIDPYSGRQRKEMLEDAFARHDAERVVTFFRGFLAEAAATDPQPPQGARQQTPAQYPNGNGQANGRPPLAAYAAPGRAGSAAQPSSAGKPVYTRSDISSFYRGLSAGDWKGREAEASAVDADIIAAGREGRVVP